MVKTKKVDGLSATTFVLIVITCFYLLMRAIAIKEMAFIFYYTLLVILNSLQLFLIGKYKNPHIIT